MTDRNTHAAPEYLPDPLAECGTCRKRDALYASLRGTFCGRCGPNARMNGIGYGEINTHNSEPKA